MSDNKFLEPKDGWGASDRIDSVSCGCLETRVLYNSSQCDAFGPVAGSKSTPFTRRLLTHPLIKKEKDFMAEDVIDFDKEGIKIVKSYVHQCILYLFCRVWQQIYTR